MIDEFNTMMKEYNAKHFNGILDYYSITILVSSLHPLMSKTLNYFIYVKELTMNENMFIDYLKNKYYLPSMKLKLSKILSY